ncbi:hypothetical protein QE152_g12827 [Popillia japonica]|uniref:Uncharacterized protein n=1 Tax=Popillia japonica TaxID=7064 RepID=A0AAW1LFZ4_POPJA
MDTRLSARKVARATLPKASPCASLPSRTRPGYLPSCVCCARPTTTGLQQYEPCCARSVVDVVRAQNVRDLYPVKIRSSHILIVEKIRSSHILIVECGERIFNRRTAARDFECLAFFCECSAIEFSDSN